MVDYAEVQRKLCPKCGVIKSRDRFFVKNRVTGQLMSWCRDCYREYGAERYRNRGLPKPPPKPKPAPSPESECTRCATVKPRSEFRRYRRACRDCERVAARLEREQFPERVKARWDKHNALHADRRREATRARYYSGDPRYGMEKQHAWRAANPDKVMAAKRRFAAAHPEQNAVDCNARRARKLAAGGKYTRHEWSALKKRHDYMCLACKRREPDIVLTADHVIPLSKGGANYIDNIQPLCQPCNSRKHTGTLDLRPLTQAEMQL